MQTDNHDAQSRASSVLSILHTFTNNQLAGKTTGGPSFHDPLNMERALIETSTIHTYGSVKLLPT